jgi:hypothetical protein
MSKVNEQAEFLQDFCALIQKAASLGFTVTAGELQRPIEMQEIYVRTGRSKTMNSKHIERMAGDLNFFIAGKYITSKELLQPLGDYWEELDPKNSWGGNWNSFKDTPHFERRAG